MKKTKIDRLKPPEKEERKIEVRKGLIAFLAEHKGKKFNSEEIAKGIRLEIGAKTLEERPRVASITDDSNIFTNVLTELMDEKKIKSYYNPSEERKSYWIEQLEISYVWEKFHMAVMSLVSGSDNIQDRLFNAVAYNNFGGLKGEWTCKETDVREKFLDLMGELEREELFGDEGQWKATTSGMSEDKASELAKRIVDIYDEITRIDERELRRP